MKFEDILLMPKGVNLKEYEKLLKEKTRLEKQIGKVSYAIYDEDDSLDVLSDEVGSERYNKHLQNKAKLEDKRKKLQVKLEMINKKIGRD